MPSRFVHLHVHSHYSLLNALPKADELVAKAKEYGMDAVAVTDNGNLYGAIEFIKAAKKGGVKPILGMDCYVAARTRFDKQAGVDAKRTRLLFLAKDTSGYKSLIKLTTRAHMDGFYYKPRIDRELIEKHREGLICIAPSFSSDITSAIKGHDIERAKAHIDWYKSIFGDDFYIEITRHPEIAGHDDTINQLVKLARETNTPIMAGHDVYYLAPEDKQARDTLLAVNTMSDVSDRGNMDGDDEDFSFISPERAEELFKDLPDALDNTRKIADQCNLDIELGKWKFPRFLPESGKSQDDELKDLAYKGVAWRGLSLDDPEVKKRLDYELEVIRMKGYAVYFLVVGDLLRESRERRILTTIRGSVAGSLTTYVLGITNVDPLEYKLPFERFLNPERPSAPDIDMDYADNRRDEIIDYARSKYGADKVAQIGTFGTMMARGAVRDVARAMGFPYALGDRISKLIPMGAQGFPMTIDRALEEVEELRDLYEGEDDVKQIIEMAKKIEGCARHISVHAAGVLISPDPLDEHVPLQYDPKGEGKVITQYDMHGAGEDGVGLLKFDFLGIRNLAILADAVDRVKKIEGIDVDIEKIDLADKKTFEMLARGETIGLFQLNGTGMTKYLKELKPSTIHDINAMVALYRPGPLESIPEYIKRKHNPMLVRFLDPRMRDILDRSFGVITYQDDVMMIAIKLAGYSWLEADKLRKAMGKKIPKDMEEQKGKLLSGLVKNGMPEPKTLELWKLIEPFAAYGFNKAHAASYGRVAYQTAFMKANYPEIYMSAVLTAESGDIEKIGEIVAEAKRMKIPVLPPSVNESFSQFTVVKSTEHPYKIRFGLVTIKNFGQGISSAIIDERKRGGPFKSLSDFLSRVKDRNLNKKSLEALIKAGALDEFEDRGKLLANVDTILAYSKERASALENQDSLFAGVSDASADDIRLLPADPMPMEAKLAAEKELLGLYISGHPLDKFKHIFEKQSTNIAWFKREPREGAPVVIGGIIEELKPIATKKGDMMAFIKVTDFSGSIEAVVFPKGYKEYKDILAVDRCIAFKGKLSLRNGEVSVAIDKLKAL